MTETQREHTISQLVVHGIIFSVAKSDNEFWRLYTKSWGTWLMVHGVAAFLTWLLYCAWQESRLSVA
jgi:hypothetical protein